MNFILLVMISFNLNVAKADCPDYAGKGHKDAHHASEKDGESAMCSMNAGKEASNGVPNDKTSFGAPLTLKKSLPLTQAITQFKANPEGPLLVEATVDKVCQKKGCWMALKSTDSDVRVTFKDYGFFVPMSLIGKTVLVEGLISEKKLSLKETKHLVEDEGGDPKSVTKPRTEYQMVALGVAVKD